MIPKVVFINLLLYSCLNQVKTNKHHVPQNISMFYPHTTPMRPSRRFTYNTSARPIRSARNINYQSSNTSTKSPSSSTWNIYFNRTARPLKYFQRRARSMDDSVVRPTSATFFDTSIDGIPTSVFEDIFKDPRNEDPKRLNFKIDELSWFEAESKTRRQQYLDPYALGLPASYTADEYRCKRQILDNMLQLIYMARYKIRRLEQSRLASLSKQKEMFKIARAQSLITTQLKRLHVIMKLHQVNMFKWINIKRHAVLHHRAAKLHMDFLYMFWVMVKLQAAAKSFQERKVLRAQKKADRIREKMINRMQQSKKKGK